MYGFRTSIYSALLIAITVPATGTAAPDCDPVRLAPGRAWDPPLNRTVSVRAARLSLKQALERLASITQLRVSYSAELLPLDREVCLSYDEVRLGDLLDDLLAGSAVAPVAAASDHIVLAPAGRAQASEGDSQPIVALAPIFATAVPAHPDPVKPAYAFTQIDHERVMRYADVAQALTATAPGVWVWQSPGGLTTRYSTRGAASFGASAPKIFIDGIEVANPLLATQLLPENIERIEVIRGPQGGALYGADAISGVTNIVTRHDVIADGAPRLRIRSGLALSRSDYIGGSGIGQDHNVALRSGSRLRSAAVNFGIGNEGEYLPGSYTRHVSLDGSLRLITDRTLITGTARFTSQSAGNPFGVIPDSAIDLSPVSLKQYAVGARATIPQGDRITHTIVLGADGYTLGDLANRGSMSSPADSLLRVAGDGALRTTARVNTVVRMTRGGIAAASVSVAAEHSNLHQYDAGSQFEQSRRSNGLVAQLDASLLDRASITAGVRLERDEVNGVDVGASTLPMISGAYSVGGDRLGARLRGAYGKAIRWPDLQQRAVRWASYPPADRSVVPEEQSGFELGVDLTVGKHFDLEVTRFDQIATGMMQGVILAGALTPNAAAVLPAYCLQSVGEIANQGWELQGTLHGGPFGLSASLSFVDSRVLRVATDYTGDLRTGDRMLGVPARTASIDATWTASRWSAALTALRAFDWIGYNRLALAGTGPADVTGGELRDYWQRYSGSTHLRAVLAHDLTSSLTLILTGDNLLDKQTGEPDNLTIVPGRTVSFGVKAAF